MIVILFILSMINLTLAVSIPWWPDPLGPPVFMLTCTADGPVQTVIVRLNISEINTESIQSSEIHINCSNGYRVEVRDPNNFEAEFTIPPDEIDCTTKFTYYDFNHFGAQQFSYKECEFPVRALAVSVGAIGSEMVGNSASLECNVTAVRITNGSVNITWMKEGREVSKDYHKVGHTVNDTGFLLYTSYYNITMLQMSDNDTTYHCQAVINTSPSVKNSSNFTLNALVPAPNVTISTLNSQTINSLLLLRCDVTTVVGIDSSVDIVWMNGSEEILRENDTKGEPINNATLMFYTSYYFNNITTLQMINDNDVYYCQAVINTNPLVDNSDNYTLNVIDPTPNVTITALNTQIFDSPLSLRCDVTTVAGIGNSVDIVWIKEDTEVLRENDTIGEPIRNATMMLYMSHYYSNITSFQVAKNNVVYYCQAVINTSPAVNNSDNYTLNVTVPTPNVTIVALNTPTVGSILSLRCDVTTEVSIDSGIDIVWMKEGAEVLRENDTNRDVISNAKLYTSYYNMTTLKLTDDNDVYHCQAIVKKNPLINNTDHYTLHVGMPSKVSDTKIKTDHHLIAIVLAVFGTVLIPICLLLLYGWFLWKNGSFRKYFTCTFAKETRSSPDGHMDLFSIDNGDFSVIGKDKASTCEYLENSSKKGVNNLKFYKHELEECDSSLASDCKEEEMLNYINGLSETDITTNKNNVASDLKCCKKDDDFYGLERMVEGREDGSFITHVETSHKSDNENHTALVSQQNESQLELHEYITHENSLADSSINPTTQSSTSPYVKIIPGGETVNSLTDNSITYSNEQLIDETLCTTPSTSNGDYVPYSTAINHASLPSMITNEDYIDYHTNIVQQPTMSNLQNAKNFMHHESLQSLKVGNLSNSNDKANNITSEPNIYIDPELIKSANSSMDSEGQYVDYDTVIA